MADLRAHLGGLVSASGASGELSSGFLSRSDGGDSLEYSHETIQSQSSGKHSAGHRSNRKEPRMTPETEDMLEARMAQVAGCPSRPSPAAKPGSAATQSATGATAPSGEERHEARVIAANSLMEDTPDPLDAAIACVAKKSKSVAASTEVERLHKLGISDDSVSTCVPAKPEQEKAKVKKIAGTWWFISCCGSGAVAAEAGMTEDERLGKSDFNEVVVNSVDVRPRPL